MDDIDELKQRFEGLRSFEEVAAFDVYALERVGAVEAAAAIIEEEVLSLQRRLNAALSAHRQKPWWKRLLTSAEGARVLKAEIASRERRLAEARSFMADALELVDYTPNDEEQQRQLLQELKLEKRELKSQKRRANEAAREVRAEARRQSADAGRVFVFYDRKLAASQRRQIRAEKEAALLPHERAKAAIERRLAAIERRMIWAERLKRSEKPPGKRTIEARAESPSMEMSSTPKSKRAS